MRHYSTEALRNDRHLRGEAKLDRGNVKAAADVALVNQGGWFRLIRVSRRAGNGEPLTENKNLHARKSRLYALTVRVTKIQRIGWSCILPITVKAGTWCVSETDKASGNVKCARVTHGEGASVTRPKASRHTQEGIQTIGGLRQKRNPNHRLSVCAYL